MEPGRSPFYATSTNGPLPGFPKTHIAIPKAYRVACPSGSRSRLSTRLLAACCFRLGKECRRPTIAPGGASAELGCMKIVEVKVATSTSGPLVALLVPLPMLLDGRAVTGVLWLHAANADVDGWVFDGDHVSGPAHRGNI
jgi:hypothetical protein